MLRLLPFDHALRNIGRRPLRSAMIVLAAMLTCGLFIASTAFVRGLERSNLAAAPARTAILLSTSAQRDVVRSAMSPAVADLVAADVRGILRVGGIPAASPEIHMGTDIVVEGDGRPKQAFVRGITQRAFIVHDDVTLIRGELPGPGEAMVGRLAAAKSDAAASAFELGRVIRIEGGEFRISGVFAAPGSATESEIWVDLAELQGYAQRDDCSAVFVRTETEDDLADVSLFAARRVDLELEAIPAKVYYAELAAYFGPIRGLVWGMAALVALAALASGANTLVATVQDRIREYAALRAIGFSPLALVVVTLQEGAVLGALGALLGILAARAALGGASMRLAMTAFGLDVDAVAVMAGLLGVCAIMVAGMIPALYRILNLPVSRALKET